MTIGIACASGSAKGVFVHGALAAFESAGLKADLYAASSSSSVPAAYAAMHRLELLQEAAYWRMVNARLAEGASSISGAVKEGIAAVLPALMEGLFEKRASRFAVAVSAVVSEEAAQLTQTDQARRLGQRLLLNTRAKDKSWADKHLATELFDTGSTDAAKALNATNLADVLYATTRMLHAWKDPAWISGRPT